MSVCSFDVCAPLHAFVTFTNCQATPWRQVFVQKQKHKEFLTGKIIFWKRSFHSCAISWFFVAGTAIAILWQSLHKAFGGKGRFYNCICIHLAFELINFNLLFIWKKTKRNQTRDMVTISRHNSGLARATYWDGNTSHHTLCWPLTSVVSDHKRGDTRIYAQKHLPTINATNWKWQNGIRWLHKWLKMCRRTGRVCWLNPWPQILLAAPWQMWIVWFALRWMHHSCLDLLLSIDILVFKGFQYP